MDALCVCLIMPLYCPPLQPFSSTAIMQQLVRTADELVAQVAAAQARASAAELTAGRTSDCSDLHTHKHSHDVSNTATQHQQQATLEAQGSNKPVPSSQASAHRQASSQVQGQGQSEVQGQQQQSVSGGGRAERQLSGHSDSTCDVTPRVAHDQQQYEMAQEMAGLVMDSHILR